MRRSQSVPMDIRFKSVSSHKLSSYYVLLRLEVLGDCSHSPRQHHTHCCFGIGTPCDFSCGSHSWYVSRDMCRRSSLFGSCVFVRVLFREIFGLSIVYVTKPFNFPGSSGGTDIAALRFHVNTIIRYSAGLFSHVPWGWQSLITCIIQP